MVQPPKLSMGKPPQPLAAIIPVPKSDLRTDMHTVTHYRDRDIPTSTSKPMVYPQVDILPCRFIKGTGTLPCL
ncbi:hypothetical protein TREMEDRAFT_57607 [Tremella mesenterica DSM 1558]|uniref:uncharacterized protein n=1 Tax=Tremella mesenterica (strain ATCC 24925 / CBS 8224 / DSM 1558 / NBRC 9311 / NRRL Y-6157 / RJB 2259-6 / UBC 559-6) TaxID=578456 RepID=UPI0003F4937B|nr:uncharacterized protein TREMEDRAFT_57607 [Tremella mesenterica DSM 1558]EIW67447.1 hypothetical protein TREMEDRAFT_57607 [Tremella mesenterica DSM 1558]